MARVLHIANWYPSFGEPKRALWIKDQIELLSGMVDYDVWHVEVIKGRFRLSSYPVSESENRLILSFPTKRWFLIEVLSGVLLVYLFLFKVKLKDYSLIHFHIAYPLLTYWHILRKMVNKPVVLSEHWSAYHYDFNITDKRKLKPIQKIFFNPLHLITVSGALAKDIVRFSGNPNLIYTVVHNVVDCTIFNFQNLDISPDTFFMVSQWKDPKDPFTVLKVLTTLPDYKLRIGGYGEQLKDIEALISELGLSDRVTLLGSLNKHEIAAEMNRATGFIHSSRYETFSVVCAEAISCGCPVIASRVGGIPEFVNESNGILVEGQSFDQWASSLIKFAGIKFDREVIQKSIQPVCDSGMKREHLLNIYKEHSID
ncbi:MAG: glycosyltransferase [Marinoscillum sp.]